MVEVRRFNPAVLTNFPLTPNLSPAGGGEVNEPVGALREAPPLTRPRRGGKVRRTGEGEIAAGLPASGLPGQVPPHPCSRVEAQTLFAGCLLKKPEGAGPFTRPASRQELNQ